MALELSTGPFGSFKRAWLANQTGGFFADVALTSFPAIGTADGFFVFDPNRYASNPPVNIAIFPFGTGTGTFDVRVVLFHKTNSGLLFHTGPIQFTATLGAAVGITGHDVSNTEKFCASVSAPAFGGAGIDCQPIAGAVGGAGYKFDANSAHGFVVRFAIGTATNANALVGTQTR